MKSIILIFLIGSNIAAAQIDLPEMSPEGTVKQLVGYTNFQIRYGRPQARKRKIMGDLVPYGKLWRTGAGRGTTISFDKPVTINGRSISAGRYALVSVPGEREWTIMLNSDTTKFYGDPGEYNPAFEIVRFQVRPEKTDRFFEAMTIDLDIMRSDAVFYLSWENTQIHFPIATGAHEEALSNINTVLSASPQNPDALALASFYYSMNNEDPEQVLRWLDKAIALGGDRWAYHQKVDMLAKLKRYPAARKAAGVAIAYLEKTKPAEWEIETGIYREKMSHWPGD